MRVAIVTKYDKKPIEKILKKFNFRVVNKNPDVVLTYGGDGTILYSERMFPSVPKLIVKYKSSICRKCDYSFKDLERLLEKLSKGEFKILEEMKLEAKFKDKRLIALNEIQIHNKLPTKAIRFSVWVNGKKFENLIGDGVIIATPFGSTAYYSSTGGKPFKKGIGISFNNLFRKRIKSFVVRENSKIKVRIEKGPALLLADNLEKFIELKEGDEVLVKKAEARAKLIFFS